MSANKRRKTTCESLKKLAETIQDQNVSWLNGSYATPACMTNLFVRDHPQVGFPFPSNEDLKALYDLAQPASFGKGNEAVVDPTYRSGRTLVTDNFAINLKPDQALLRQIQSFMIDSDVERSFVRADLYRVNIYGPGDFFKVHKDTPQAGAGHFGSLVFCLPTIFEGGAFVLRSTRGEEVKFDWASSFAARASSAVATNASTSTAGGANADVEYLAFASDLDHWVEPVVSGYRVTVTFHLFREILAPDRLVQPVLEQFKGSEVLQAVEASSSELAGRMVLFPLVHYYSDREGREIVLKGGDASLFQCLKQLGVAPKVMFYYDAGCYQDDHCEPGLEIRYLTESVTEFTRKGMDDNYRAIDDLAVPHEVMWARNPSENQLLSVGGTYGNEPGMAAYYGDACILTSW
jgi:hypothetical protein